MMKKRMTAGMLATLMAAVLPVSACAAQNSAPQPQLNTAEHMQYMNGYTDGTFRPDASITRAEASKLLTSLLVDWGEHRDYLFSDVSVSAWYANAVCQMINFGLVNGYTDGTFKPNAKITRAEFVAILSRFPHTDIGTDKSFADVPRTQLGVQCGADRSGTGLDFGRHEFPSECADYPCGDGNYPQPCARPSGG